MQAIDLLEKLLVLDPKKRIDATKAAMVSWLGWASCARAVAARGRSCEMQSHLEFC
jgi:hypothetical protein